MSLNGIWLVTMVHFLWGCGILIYPGRLPVPFGALHAYTTYMPTPVVGALLFFSALLPMITFVLKPKKRGKELLWCIASLIPQQVILFWSVGWVFWTQMHFLLHGISDVRYWFVLGYLVPFLVFHYMGMDELYRRAREHVS